MVVDYGPHFGIWRVGGDECGLDLHLLDESVVVVRVGKHIIVPCETCQREPTAENRKLPRYLLTKKIFNLLYNGDWEVGVPRELRMGLGQ